MGAGVEEYRRAVLDKLSDLPKDQQRRVAETVDEWLGDRDDTDLPPVNDYVTELRDSLHLSTPSSARRIVSWARRHWLSVSAFVVVTAASTGALTWWLSTDGDLQNSGGGVWSDTMPHRDFNNLLDSPTTVFRCQAGDLRVQLFLRADSRAVLKSVQLALLDDSWSGVVHRTSATAQPNIAGGGGPVPLDGYQFTVPAQVTLSYEFDRCPVPMDGFTAIDVAEVTYELLGRTHHDTVELISPVVLTGCRLSRLPNGC